MLIRCAGNKLIPMHTIDLCEESGDSVVVWSRGQAFHAHGDDAAVIRALVAKIGKNKKKEEQ